VTKPRLLIADDHKIVAEGLVRLLADRYEIVDTVAQGGIVIDAVVRRRPDVLLLDLSMPDVSGIEVLRQLRRREVDVKVIVLTMHADASLAVEALRSGASGYVLKESSGDELVTALQVVLGGGTYLASALTKEVLTLMMSDADAGRAELTARQLEVLRLIVRGQRAKEIAATLGLSTRSVEAIKYKIMQQLDVHSTAELVRYAVENRRVRF
jgi:DNA-binding NarL/FixJ family response regulator